MSLLPSDINNARATEILVTLPHPSLCLMPEISLNKEQILQLGEVSKF
jgi:hypothetical protein